MATFPTFESVLLEISTGLGIKTELTSKAKSKFKNTEMSLGNFYDTWQKIILEIAHFFDLDENVTNDLLQNIRNDYAIHKAIETSVFTFKASKEKIVWHYLARVLIPALARHTVFWQIESKLDAGMPGGKFWYLPYLDPSKEDPKVELPIPQVLNWLIDLIEKPKSSIAKDIEHDLKIHDMTGTVLKNLHNWLKAKNTPEVSSIKNTFPDEVKIKFHGCFQPNFVQPEFNQAIQFVIKKGHTPETLQHEIAITSDDLKAYFQHTCSEDQKTDFVLKIQERYQAPSTKTIRQRLIVARATQNGYERLVKLITPHVDKLNINPEENKALQLVKVYELTYNETLKSHLEFSHSGEKNENKNFTQNLPPFLRYDLLLCVATEHYATVPLVAPRLSHIFSDPKTTHQIDHIFPYSQKMMEEISISVTQYASKQQHLDEKTSDLVNLLQKNKAPFKKLQSIEEFQIVHEASQYDYPNKNIKGLISQRLNELAVTQYQKIQSIFVELHEIFVSSSFNLQTEKKVEELISSANQNDEAVYWKPFILKYEAYHLIAQNKLKEAEKRLNIAMDECKKYNFASLRGTIARDAFALAIANQKLIPNNHEKYYRDIIYWGGLEDNTENKKTPDFFDISRELHEYFWKSLYQCYPNYPPLFSSSLQDLKSFLPDFQLVVKDQQQLNFILEKHKHLKSKQLKSPQSDSIIFLLIKISYDMKSKFKNTQLPIPADVIEEVISVSNKTLSAVRDIIKEWHQIVDISDFKQQTPLMLAANHNDVRTVEALLEANANPNLQDLKGRTALHAAMASGCIDSAKLIIKHGIDANITTIENATVLHTAVRMGNIQLTKLILSNFPELINSKDHNDMTAKDLAFEVANNEIAYHILTGFLVRESRSIVSHKSYKELLNYLNDITNSVTTA